MKNINKLLFALFIFSIIITQSTDYDCLAKNNITNQIFFLMENEWMINSNSYDLGTIHVISEPFLFQNNNINQSYSPKIVTENNLLYVVWADYTDFQGSGEGQEIFFRHFDGSKWLDIEVISEPVFGSNINTNQASCPSIDVENGNIYVVWQSKGGIFLREKYKGSDWTDIQNIPDSSGGQDPDIAVENGKIYATWERWDNDLYNAGNDADIFYTCNLTGTSWEPIRVISEPVLGKNINDGNSVCPKIGVENNNIYIVWFDRTDYKGSASDNDIFYRYHKEGSGWEDIQVISEPIINENLNGGESVHPSIAVENENIYVVWVDGSDIYGTGKDNDVFFRCYISGKGWNDIQVLTEPLEDLDDGYSYLRNPEIDVHNGKIFVVWDDIINVNNGGTNGEILYRCNLTGSNWEDIQVVSEPEVGEDINTGHTYGPDIAVNAGTGHVVWWGDNDTQGSGTDPDIFYRPISVTQVLGLEKLTPSIGNTSTDFNFTASYFNLLNGMPQEVVVTIDNMTYNMFEVDGSDSNIIDGKQYFFNVTNLDIGEHSYFIRASYGGRYTYSDLLTGPTVYNTPPHIITQNNLTAFEDYYYEASYNYIDIDKKNIGQQCRWTFSSNAKWLGFDKGSGVLNGTPSNDDVGNYWVNITISDTIDIDFTNFTLTVLNVNDPPEITVNDKINASAGELYSVNYHAVDIDPPPVTLSWSLETNASGWLELDPISGWLHGIAGNEDTGSFWVNVSVKDGEGGLDFRNFTLRVFSIPGQHNTPPILFNQTFSPLKGDTDTTFTFTVHYFDSDADKPDPIQVVIDGAGYFMTLGPGENATNGLYFFSGKLSEGGHVYYYTASDGEGTVKTNETATPYVRKASDSDRMYSWYGLSWVVMIVVILILILVTYVYIKRKISKIPTVKTEILPPVPVKGGLPAVRSVRADSKTSIAQKATVKSLPSQQGSTGSTIDIRTDKTAVTTLPSKPITPQLQLPKETLSKSQKLGLLQERFLRGEVSEEIYIQLKSEIESTGEEGSENIIDDD